MNKITELDLMSINFNDDYLIEKYISNMTDCTDGDCSIERTFSMDCSDCADCDCDCDCW